MNVTGWRCATCRATVDIASPFPFRCPNSTDVDRRHVLQIVRDPEATFAPSDHANPFIRYDAELAWAACADANGMGESDRAALIEELDRAVRSVDRVGFTMTPFERSVALSDAIGSEATGGVWVKDETGSVGGSQKARHLFSILLHLRACEDLGLLSERPRLAIASCGNAALAAATLAKSADWPLDVYVPTWMGDGFGDRLDDLGAAVHRSERRSDDPPGDPAMLRFRDAVAAGAIPFTVQGTENALCLDGGRTMGWEIAEQSATSPLDRLYVQVGGGAFAASVGAGLLSAGNRASLYAVQAEGCAPLARAWERGQALEHPASQWAELMTIWDDPASLADGILDDETYDWVGIFDALHGTGGAPVVASESAIIEAHDLAQTAGFDASATGTAGLAGLLTHRASIAPSERVGVVMSGVTR